MKEQFVTYEIALKLKELGFNDYCLRYYHINKQLSDIIGDFYKNSGSTIDTPTAPL